MPKISFRCGHSLQKSFPQLNVKDSLANVILHITAEPLLNTFLLRWCILAPRIRLSPVAGLDGSPLFLILSII